MELITKLSGLLKAITYTIRVIVSGNFKTVKRQRIYHGIRNLSPRVRDTVNGSVYFRSKVNFKCPPNPSLIIRIKVESLISLASFSILEM